MYGPMQLSVIGFDNEEVIGGLLDELDRVREFGIIRLIDFLFVAKDEGGDIGSMEVTVLSDEERTEFGAVIGGLIGLGAAGAEGAVAGAVEGALARIHHCPAGMLTVTDVFRHIPTLVAATLSPL